MVRELTIGGCERDLTKLAKHLDRAQFTPYVGCFHPNGYRADELREAGIPIVEFPVRSFYSYSALRAARIMRGNFLREHQIQSFTCLMSPPISSRSQSPTPAAFPRFSLFSFPSAICTHPSIAAP